MAKMLLLNGPNLNLLGTHEPGIYGHASLSQIEAKLVALANDQGHQCDCLQSNREYELIERIHQAAQDQVQFIIFNPAAFTHTSVALRDALLGVNIPFIEVHLSNVYQREAFRQQSYFSEIAVGVLSGFGALGYEMAFQAALKHLDTAK